jgi:hypothetical protein
MSMADVPDTQRMGRVLDAATQLVLILGVWAVYLVGRHVFEGSERTAHAHADDIWSLERTLRLPSEARLQEWVLNSDGVVRVVNAVYQYVHFPAIVCTLIILYVWRRDVFGWFRNVLTLTTGLALVGHIAYPLAPPRLQPDLGIVDTGVEFGQTSYGEPPGTGFTNQIAAMPSMHVAWAALIAISAIVCLRTRWRWLLLVYAAMLFLVVVVTGNHYWLDGIVGLALLGIAMLVFPLSRSVSTTRGKMQSEEVSEAP